jgi:hypothetical protein
LRAVRKIGELSRELEKAEPAKGHGAGLSNDGKTKQQKLADAGISTTSAHRYEKLAGPPRSPTGTAQNVSSTTPK